MKYKLYFTAFWCLVTLVSFGAKKVSFFQDSVSEIDGKVVKFLGGSIWLMEKEIIAPPLHQGILITSGSAPKYNNNNMRAYMKALPKRGTLVYRGNEVGVTLTGGVFKLQDGILARVVSSHGKGSVLETNDGALWLISSYDQYDSGWWFPPYPVLIYGNEMNLINLKKGKKISVNKRVK